MDIFEGFRRPSRSVESEAPELNVGDLVSLSPGAKPSRVEYVGEEVVVFRPVKYADNPNPGGRVGVYEAIRGSKRYEELAADASLVEARTRPREPYVEVARGGDEKGVVVMRAEDLKRAA